MTSKTVVRSALVSGTIGSVTSTLALMVLARAEGASAWQPTNATSHWLNGAASAAVARPDVAHTAVGYATHHVATTFWALPFEAWLATEPRLSPQAVLGRALVVSVVAAAVDYGATLKRFTPGWEFVLSKRAMALAYGAMALGLAAGALLARNNRAA